MNSIYAHDADFESVKAEDRRQSTRSDNVLGAASDLASDLFTFQRVTRKAKSAAKSLSLASPGPKKTSGIRLHDLMPKKRVTGGKGLLFGATDNSQPPTNQPEEAT